MKRMSQPLWYFNSTVILGQHISLFPYSTYYLLEKEKYYVTSLIKQILSECVRMKSYILFQIHSDCSDCVWSHISYSGNILDTSCCFKTFFHWCGVSIRYQKMLWETGECQWLVSYQLQSSVSNSFMLRFVMMKKNQIRQSTSVSKYQDMKL